MTFHLSYEIPENMKDTYNYFDIFRILITNDWRADFEGQVTVLAKTELLLRKLVVSPRY